jgi:hypothetical protein
VSVRVQDGEEKGRDESGDTENGAGAQAKGNDLPLSREEAGKREKVSNCVVDRPRNYELWSTAWSQII